MNVASPHNIPCTNFSVPLFEDPLYLVSCLRGSRIETPRWIAVGAEISGLKTFTRTKILECAVDGVLADQDKADISAGFQAAVVDTLAIKCKRAMQQTGINRLIIAGGVGANRNLREKLRVTAESLKGAVYYPRPELCTDNGAMIAYAGTQRLLAGEQSDTAVSVVPRWPMTSLTSVDGVSHG